MKRTQLLFAAGLASILAAMGPDIAPFVWPHALIRRLAFSGWRALHRME
jgi:hypothetical protein